MTPKISSLIILDVFLSSAILPFALISKSATISGARFKILTLEFNNIFTPV